MNEDPLALFHPAVREWFRERVGTPTEVQALAWPPIAAGRHVLLTAPTGSGKTLTAFLWALDGFAAGRTAPGATRVLYVSPLKALNSDIRRNLLGPLEEIRARLSVHGAEGGESGGLPDVRVEVRSGDTPPGERRRMLRRPPEILITTPESLNLLLLSEAGRESLRGLGTVILDEVHAVAGGKRGVHLITAVDRLVGLAGEFQRIALSATVKPLSDVAAWVGGYRREGGAYAPRPVEIVRSAAPKEYRLEIRYPVAGEVPGNVPGGRGDGKDGGREGATDRGQDGEDRAAEAGPGSPEADIGVWERMAREIKDLVSRSRSTLIFANNRRLSERLARLLNEGEAKPVAYAHHGSLSREIRAVVEARLKEGRLPAVVATASLELGIDIGALDRVVLVETPASVAAALQRLGRAGHGVGQASAGTLFASHGADLVAAAVASRCVREGDIEAIRPVENPLDVLSQVLLAMAATGTWTVDGLYGAVRASHPYRDLPRRSFDAVMAMLAGRYQETRIRELRPRLAVDAVDGTVRALKGAPLLLGISGGTIPDRGYYALRHAGTRARIGELDEEFVWERREGELFTLGSQSWRITAIGANDVEVVPAGRQALLAPFWRAESRDRDAHFSDRLGEFLEEADARLSDPAFVRGLEAERGLDAAAAEALAAYLRRQRAATGAPLPHRRHLLVEETGNPAAPDGAAGVRGYRRGARTGRQGRRVILHAVWGGRLLRPFGYALAAAWEERGGAPLEIVQDDDALLVGLADAGPGDGPAGRELLELVRPDNLEDLLRRTLAGTGFFAARFRENAARALLLPRSLPGRRVPLWLNRIRSRGLLGAVAGFGDFPLVLETWRECLRDEFDLPALKARLEELQAGTVRVREVRTASPSPFAAGLLWKQTNQFVYEPDRAPGPGAPARPAAGGARPDLLREIAFAAPLRPRIPRDVVAAFEAKAQRLAPGYAPQGARELAEWAGERVLVPWPEWSPLLPEAGPDPDGADPALQYPASYLRRRLARLRLPGARVDAVAAAETLPRLLRALGLGPDDAGLGDPLSPGGEADPALREALGAALREPGMPAAPEYDGPGSGGEAPAPGEDAAAALEGLLGQWLRAYGPVTRDTLAAVFGAALPRVEAALVRLAEAEAAILDALSEDASPEAPEACDAANVEILLRSMRRRARPQVSALPASALPLFAAAWQGLAAPATDEEGLQGALERLFGYPAPAAAWEADILPARVMPYRPDRLDALFRDSDLLWFGAGRARTAFAFPEDLDLFLPADGGPGAGGGGAPANGGGEASPAGSAAALRRQVLAILAAAAPARLDYAALSARLPAGGAGLAGALWDLAWEGRITNDTFAALRRGVETGFRLEPPAAEAAAPRRGRFQRWKATRPLAGSWLAIGPGAAMAGAGAGAGADEAEGGAADAGEAEAGRGPDPLEREELAKDRVRQLLRRHGVLFRENLAHELPALQWPRVFRALRLMELSGEVLSGRFFEGIAGPQFLSPQALPLLEDGLPGDAVYWMSALDPASPAGLGLEGLPYALPPRAAGTHLVFHGARLALVSRRLGRDLAVDVPPRHPYLAGYLSALRHLVDRAVLPARSVEVETVNGVGVLGSPYLEDLLDAGFEKGIRTVTLRKAL